MKSTQLQICLLALFAASWTFERAYTQEEKEDHLVKTLEPSSISSPSVSENVRVKRQEDDATTTTTTPKPKKPRPQNIFKLISVLATETKDDTRKALNEIGALFNAQFANGTRSTTTTTTTTAAPDSGTQGNSTTTESSEDITTTTEAFRLTRDEFLGIIRNNLQGIVRLFRKEVKIALADSNKNAKEFGKELGMAFRPLIYGKN